MKPKNRKERTNSLLKFLAIFLVTVSMIVVAVYFNFKIPAKENKLLREQAEVIKGEMGYQNSFYVEMQSLKGMIDSLDIPGQNMSYQNSLISTQIVDLQKNIPPKGSSHIYDMHMGIIQLYVELQTAKIKLHSLQDAESTIEEYKEALEKCQSDLKQSERELYIERRSN